MFGSEEPEAARAHLRRVTHRAIVPVIDFSRVLHPQPDRQIITARIDLRVRLPEIVRAVSIAVRIIGICPQIVFFQQTQPFFVRVCVRIVLR